MEKRLRFLKAGKENEYQESILQSQLEFQKILARTTQLAADFMEFDQETFLASIEEAKENPETREILLRDVEQVRHRNDTENATHLTREKTKEIILEKIRMEFESEKKHAHLTPKSS